MIKPGFRRTEFGYKYVGEITCCKCGKKEWQYMGNANFCRACTDDISYHQIREKAMFIFLAHEDKIKQALLK